jgi:ferredoxin
MAKPERRLEQNCPGPWYVDKYCICCGVCVEVAPENMALDEKAGVAYVSRQPETDIESANIKEASEQCPVSAIGKE